MKPNWPAISNWLGSAVGFGVTAFLTTFLVDAGMPFSLRCHSAGSAFLAALISHLREIPPLI